MGTGKSSSIDALLDGLRALDATESEGSFRGAAPKLRTTHPTVKKRVAAFADLAGTDLVVNVGGRTELTASAKDLLRTVRTAGDLGDPAASDAVKAIFKTWVAGQGLPKVPDLPTSLPRNKVVPSDRAGIFKPVRMANYWKVFPFPLIYEWKDLVSCPEDASDPRNFHFLSYPRELVLNRRLDAAFFCAIDRKDLGGSLPQELRATLLGEVFFDNAVLERSDRLSQMVALDVKLLARSHARSFAGLSSGLAERLCTVASEHRFTIYPAGSAGPVRPNWTLIPSLCAPNVGENNVAMPIRGLSFAAELYLIYLQGCRSPGLDQLQKLLTRWVNPDEPSFR